MLILGPYRACVYAMLPNVGDEILNFSSLNQEIPRLNYLMPNMPDICTIDPLMADQMYYQYIMENEYAFIDMMRIMMPLYEGRNVYICTSGDVVNQYVSLMNELLTKFISNRYGYNHVIINEPDDIGFFDPGDYHFSVPGILNMDLDRERWALLAEKSRINQGGAPYGSQPSI